MRRGGHLLRLHVSTFLLLGDAFTGAAILIYPAGVRRIGDVSLR